MRDKPKLIRNWKELSECTSETHTLEVDKRFDCGWIRSKTESEADGYSKDFHYLSTHTFYGSNYIHSTELLQRCGFNVQLANWDE